MRRERRSRQRHRLVGIIGMLGVAGLAVAFWLPSEWFTRDAHADHGNMIPALGVDYVWAQYEKGRKLTPIDLRSADEFRNGHLPGARSLPLDQLAVRFQEVPRVDLVVLYCDCTRSEIEGAYRFLRRQQYRNLSVLEPGFAAWAQRGYPVER